MRLSSMQMVFCCWFLCSYMDAAAGTLPCSLAEPEHQGWSTRAFASRQRRLQDADVHVRHGVLFQTNCPQAITSEEANDIAAHNVTSPGNTITITSQPGGRTGNRYEGMSQAFSMAYCCRSNLLVLPKHDREMLHEEGSRWSSAHRWYDFSEAEMDLLPEFADLYDRPDVCVPELINTGQNNYNLNGAHPDLQRCLNFVYVRGCEAKYLGSVINATTAFCFSRGDQSNTGTTDDNHQRRLRDREPTLTVYGNGQHTGTGSSETAGSLVIHIRSGDIFKGKKRAGFGQPPLKFFLGAIASKDWSDVSIITYSTSPQTTNPTYKALGLLNSLGLLGPNVILHNNRPLLEDVQAMICADALAVARSSLHFLTFAQTRAKIFYLPGSCGPGQYVRRTRTKNDGSPKRTPDNATLLVLEKPGAEVYGIEWEENRESYAPYHDWTHTDAQLLEMVLFDGVKAPKRCSVAD